MHSYLSDWPGKSAPDFGEHPAIYHMLDVAAVAERILQRDSFSPQRKAAFTLLVGLHDLGKVGAVFRDMLRQGKKQEYKHWELTEAWLATDKRLCDALGAEKNVWRILVAGIAGHHGRPPYKDEVQHKGLCQRAGADAARDAGQIVLDMFALWPEASLAGITRSEAKKLSWWLSGLTVAADWVGSNQEWFPAHLPDLSPADYLAAIRPKAIEALRKAGLSGADVRGGELFDFALRPMQAATRNIPLPDGPMLAFIEDETGTGKTEAALILAHRMLAAGKGRGLFVALPTMATADAMFARAEKIMGRLMHRPSIALAHGRAGLSEAFQDMVGRQRSTGSDADDRTYDDVTCTPWLADSRRRALLADVGIGTIDQTILAILQTRFCTLRLWGLASKILIVDEAHEISGNGYTGALLEELLATHAALGGSAILLTATLPLNDRQKLTAAFAKGAGQDWAADTNRAYPALSIPGGAARHDFDQHPGARGLVKIVRLSTEDDAVARLVAAASRGAACVWVRNAVDDAIAAVDALRAQGVEASLLHARFAVCDRKRIEATELARFGPNGTDRQGRVLVGTQVLSSAWILISTS